MCLIVNLFNRTVGRSENLGLPVLFDRYNLPPTPLVEITFTKKKSVEISTSLKDQLEMPKIKDRQLRKIYFGPYKTILCVSHSISLQYSHSVYR